MKIEGATFAAGAVFWYGSAGVYWWLSEETVGSTALVFTGMLATIVGAYLLTTSRRMEPRPEDRGDADISDGAGELGFFSPGSWWPIAMAGAATITGFGLAFVAWWLVIIGVGLLVTTIVGLTFEYYTGLGRSDGQPTAATEH